MAPPRFLQIHFLTTFPGSLLNRDDAGLAKRLPFGGTSRTRISSQCLKRHWRTADGEHSLRSLGIDMSIRSRAIFEREIFEPLAKEGLDRDGLQSVLSAIQRVILKSKSRDEDTAATSTVDDDTTSRKSRAKKGKASADGVDEKAVDLATAQLIALGRPEIRYLMDAARGLLPEVLRVAPEKRRAHAATVAERYLKEHAPNLEAMSAGLDVALFGRMVTSDILARGDAAIHVAHAFTVHAEETETDYFTAVDDLLTGEEHSGAAHVNEAELTSGVYYGYVVVDVPGLVSNLQGCDAQSWESADRTLAARVCRNLLGLIATVSPGAKKGSTAPYAYADLLLVESGTRMPRTLANAFLQAVKPGPRGDLRMAAVVALAAHLDEFDRMYGRKEERRIAATLDVSALPAARVASVDLLGEWVQTLVGGRA
jgi:CRISPR system Cascade subunit CasC